MKDQVFEGFVKLLMSNFLESKESDTPRLVLSNDHNVYIKFLASVERLYVQKKQVSEYADELAVSANYLSEVIKRISGYSASFHIQQRIILEAKRKSKATDNSMKKIAFELGFEDPSTFSKYFRTNTGTNFTDFRKECLF